MKYRYFYNAQGKIVGSNLYKSICLVEGMSGSIGYIDSETKVVIADYNIDLTTLTLVAKSQ